MGVDDSYSLMVSKNNEQWIVKVATIEVLLLLFLLQCVCHNLKTPALCFSFSHWCSIYTSWDILMRYSPQYIEKRFSDTSTVTRRKMVGGDYTLKVIAQCSAPC